MNPRMNKGYLVNHSLETEKMHRTIIMPEFVPPFLSCSVLMFGGKSLNEKDDSGNITHDSFLGDIGDGSKIKVGIVGSGAVGSYYGARLWECSDTYDVKFHMRGDHYSASTSSGLQVQSVDGDIFIPPLSLQAYESNHDIGEVDWVVIALKSTGLDAVPSLIAPMLKKDGSTRVLAIMNGFVDDDLVSSLRTGKSSVDYLPCAAVYGGMALICSNRIAPGKIDHSYAGGLTCGVAASVSSPKLDDVTHDLRAVENLWKPTKIKFTPASCLVRGRWEKMCWNLPFNGVSVSMGGITVDKIVTDPGLRRLADLIMDETIAVANADLNSRGMDSDMITYLGQDEKNRMWNLSDSMGPYKPSTMLDLLAGKPMEVNYMFRKAVDRANQLNIPVPHLETIVNQIEAKMRFRNLF